MSSPTANITYLGESYGPSSAADPPATNSKAKVVVYTRSEQYTDFSAVTFGGRAMTRHVVQSGGGAIEAMALWGLEKPSYAEVANDNVAWTSGFGNNFKWGMDIMHGTADVEFVAGGKETFTSWQVNKGPDLDPGERDGIAIIVAQARGTTDASKLIVQDVNGITPTLMYSANSLDSQPTRIWTVPVAGGIGTQSFHVYPDWPLKDGTVMAMIMGEAPQLGAGSFTSIFPPRIGA